MKRTCATRFWLLSILLIFVASGCSARKAAEQETADSSVVMPGPDSAAGSASDSEDPAADPAALQSADGSEPPDSAAESGPPTDESETVARPTAEELLPCYSPPAEGEQALLDRGQKQLYQTVCSTVAWFDGFFGDRRYDYAYKETYGRISLSSFWDQYDGFDTRLRFRAKLQLPALNNRANLLIGRGDERELIEGQQQTPTDSIPSNFNQVEDDSFLLGLGYTKNSGLKRGFDLSLGVKLNVPPDPYAKVRFRRAWNFSDSTLFRLSPVGYWKLEEGFGTTLTGTLDQILTEKLVFRWQASGNISEDKNIEGVAWNNWFSVFQALANRKAMSYHAFVLGETKADVQTQNFGVEFRYRQRILRKWLFLDIVTSYSWPRFLLEEEREGNFGIGAGFEMYFGPVPDIELR